MIRVATYSDISKLNQLIAESARKLSKNHYSAEQIDGTIRYVFGVDAELIHDQSYYVIEEDGIFLACGGWSRRSTLFGGDQFTERKSGYLDPKKDPAKIRAFFVHPDAARKGYGSLLLTYCEQQAVQHGFTRLEMMATLPGAKLYEVRGYKALSNEDYCLPNQVIVKFIRMGKQIVV
jgi:GNAT superfamily N-acetyltransferase